MPGDDLVDLSGLNVLLVEDERFAVRLELMALKQLGITHITIAEDGEQALALLRQERFDLVLSDWNVPAANGIEVLKFLRNSDDRRIPFIMLTGNKALDAVHQAVAAGVDGYLVKPFSVGQLRSKVVHALRKQGKLAPAELL